MGKLIMSAGNGGGVLSSDTTATAEYVVKGKTYVGADTDEEVGTGTLELTGDVTNEFVLEGKTYYKDNPLDKQTGTMPNLSEKATIKYSTSNNTPVIEADQVFLNENSDGTKRVLVRYSGDKGYLKSNTLFGYPASEFGDATAAHILKGKTATSENGLRITGIVEISSVLSFNVAAYNTSQLLCTWKNPAQASGRPFSGVVICCKTDSYPTSPNDGFVYMGSGGNSTAQGTASTVISGLTSGTTYYVRIWAYCICSSGNYTVNSTKILVSESYRQATCTTTASGRKSFTASGTWTIPDGIRTININAVGGGGGGRTGSERSDYYLHAGNGGSGGGTSYQTNISVEPGDTVTFVVGAGGDNITHNASGTYKTGSDTIVTIDNTANTSITAGGGYSSNAVNSYVKGGTGGDETGSLGTDGGRGGGGADFESNSQDPPFAGEDGNCAFNNSNETKFGAGGGGGGGWRYYSGAESETEYYGASGGSTGGGKGGNTQQNGTDGSAGTGSGGGGGGYPSSYNPSVPYGVGGSGGSGCIIITW